MTTRRTILRTAALAPAAVALAPPARAAGPFRVGLVYVAPVADAGYTFQHDLGRRAIEAKLGSAVKTSFVENVEEGADAERVIRNLAKENDLVFTTSFGFMNPTVKVAKQFPDVKFEHATGYKREANLATYSARFYEGRFLAGVLAGMMTKSGVIGFVGAFPIPEVMQNINAFAVGARLARPDVQVKLVMVSTWYDPARERTAADTLMSQGADVITTHTDSPAVQQAGEERGVYTIGFNSDMGRFGARTCLTSVVTDWSGYYVGRVQAAMAGGWSSTDTWGGIKDGMIVLAPFNAAVPKAVADEVLARQAEIVSGKLLPFAGPLSTQAGSEKAAAGAALSDKDILTMDWLVPAVQGKA